MYLLSVISCFNVYNCKFVTMMCLELDNIARPTCDNAAKIPAEFRPELPTKPASEKQQSSVEAITSHLQLPRCDGDSVSASSADFPRTIMSPSAVCPSRLELVPIVYINADGVPTCYEVVEPVPSLSHLTSADARTPSTCGNGLYCR